MIGSSVAASGNGFTSPSNVTNNFQVGTSGGIDGKVYVHKFTGLPNGKNIIDYALNISSLGNGTFISTNNFQAGTSAGLIGDIYVHKFTGLANHGNITKFGLNVNTAAGHVRIKFYDDVGNVPTHLIGESGSLTVPGTGLQNFTVLVPFTGSTIWAGFETDNNTLSLKSSGGIGNTQIVAHAYGPGPNPCSCQTGFATDFWTQVTYTVPDPNVRVKIYTDSGGPTSLLAQSNSIKLTGIGIQKIPITLPIPASGNVWGGFETDSNFLVLKSSPGIGNTQTNNTGHVYGIGPDPCGCPNGFGTDFWSSILFSPGYSFTWDNTPLSFTPSIIGPNSTGGFSGVLFTVPSSTFGTHVVNASDGILFATAPFTIPYATSIFTITGYVIGPNGFFPYPSLNVVSSGYLNMTQLQLFNATNLLQTKTFTPPIHVFANTTTSIPWNFTDATLRTGTQTYTEQATLKQNSFTEIISSNQVTLNYGSLAPGNIKFNYTNPTQVPIWFIRGDHGSNTRLSVIFPNSANLTCNLAYQTAQTNHTYFNLPKVTYDPNQKNSSFLFINGTNDFVKVNCTDLNNHSNQGQYVLTLANFPFVQQIKDFRSGMYGTTGQFGMLDIITLSVVIFSMIGFNRINEAVGAFFSLAIIGATAYFGILTFPGIVLGAVAVVTVLGITSVRKIGGF